MGNKHTPLTDGEVDVGLLQELDLLLEVVLFTLVHNLVILIQNNRGNRAFEKIHQRI